MVAGAPDVKVGRHRQVGSVGPGLIPTLDGGTDRTGDNGEIQRSGLAPLIKDLIAKSFGFDIGQGKFPGYVFVVCGVLGNEGTLLQEGEVFGEALLGGKGLDIVEENIARDSGEGILDPDGRRRSE